MKIKIPYELKKMNSLFEEAGFEAFLVGGAVRDVVLGKEAHDWDVATNAKPEDVMKIFHKVIPTGIDHGTVTVHLLKKEIEVTTYRIESTYSDGRHPDSVKFASNIEEDLSRRDFTINAMAASLKDGTIVDPFGGQEDIKNKIIRTVGSPFERFNEDGLRPVRALRFSSQLGFEIEKSTFDAIKIPEIQKKISSVSVERFRDELSKLLKSEKPSIGLEKMAETGVLSIFIPELDATRKCEQVDDRGYHEFNVFYHSIYSCDGSPKENFIVRLASLFHDLGKVPCAKEEERLMKNEKGEDVKIKVISFHGHESEGEKIAKKVMTNLRFSNAEIEKVCHLIGNHMFHYESSWTDAAIRRFLVKAGKENINDLIDLRYADIFGMHNCKIDSNSQTVLLLNEFIDRIEKEKNKATALSLKDLKINGNDLIKMGIKPGKQIGLILNELFQTVLDDPKMNDKESLEKVVERKFL